jgi:tRNA A-37 threonylcarbamoyl transferase component Bud32
MPERLYQLGKYEIVRELGRGAFATVYRARDTTLDREVALKILHPQLLTDPTFIARFKREAQTMAKLDHPHIATVYEIGESENRVYLSLYLAKGHSLGEVLAERGRFSWEQAQSLLRPIGEALDYAHRLGVVHRDLKPSNILLDESRGVLLTDFGFARLIGDSSVSLSGGILGTPAYIAPEVWELDAAAPPSDIYALACIVHEILTGTVLFAGKTPMQSMRAHDQGPQYPGAWPEDVPRGIEAVLSQALARDPVARYPDGAAFYQALCDLAAPRTGDRSSAVGDGDAAGQNVLTAEAADARLAELAGRTVRGVDDVPELLEAYFDVLKRAPSISRFGQHLVALNGLQDAWEQFGAASSTVGRGETLDAALDLAGSFPPIQSFLMGLRDRGVGAPWAACRAPVAEQISTGVRAWEDADLSGARGAWKAAKRQAQGDAAAAARWLPWLEGLIQAVDRLRAQDVNNAQEWIARLNYQSEETRFLEGWLAGLQAYESGDFATAVDLIQRLENDLVGNGRFEQLIAYKSELEVLRESAEAGEARHAVVLRLQAGEWGAARRKLEQLDQLTEMTEELAAYETALQQLAQAEREVALGRYVAARASLQAGREAVAAFVSEDGGRKLSNHLSDSLNHVESVFGLIRQVQDRMVSVNQPDTMRWEALRRCLREVKEGLPDGIGDERVVQYLTVHRVLAQEYENGHKAYAKTLDAWIREVPNHPFAAIYERWQPPKTLADYLADAKGLILQQRVPEAYEILCGLDGEPGYQDTAAPRCCEVIEAARVALRAGTRGNYHTAREKLRQAEGALTSIRDGDLRHGMQAWLTPIRQALNNAADFLSEAVREMDDVARVLEMHWAQLDRPLVRAIGEIEAVFRDSNVWSPAPDNLLETLAYQRHFHNKLRNDHKGGNRAAYAKDLQAFVDRYPNHPYRPLYERWIPEEEPETAAFPVWGWGVVGFVIVLGFVAASVLSDSLNILGAGSTPVVTPSAAPTATPRPTWTPLPREMMEDQVADLTENCGPIREDYEAEKWERLLNKVDAVAEKLGESFPQVAAEIGDACDLAAMVAEAGRSGAKAKYEAGNYGMAESITTQALGQLDTLRTTMAIDAAAYRDLTILQGCARMRARGFMTEGAEMSEEDRAVVREVFGALAAMSAETGFYNDFAQLCGFSYPEAEDAFGGGPLPTAMPAVTKGVQPTPPSVDTPESCQPQAPTNRMPANKDTLYAGFHDQKFAWMDGALCKGQAWQVLIDGEPASCDPLTTIGQETYCNLPLDTVAHTWSVRAVWQESGRLVSQSSASTAWIFYLKVAGGGKDCSKDSDGDGLNDCEDKCPNQPGPSRTDGCR